MEHWRLNNSLSSHQLIHGESDTANRDGINNKNIFAWFASRFVGWFDSPRVPARIEAGARRKWERKGVGGRMKEREREEEKGSIYLVELDRCQAHQRKWNLGLFLSLSLPPSAASFSPFLFVLLSPPFRFWSLVSRRSSPMLKRRPLDICTRPVQPKIRLLPSCRPRYTVASWNADFHRDESGWNEKNVLG